MQSGDGAAAAERAVYAGNGFLAGGLRQRRRVWRVVVLVGGVGWLLHTRRRGRLRARRVWAMRLGGRMRVVERGGHGLHWGGRYVWVVVVECVSSEDGTASKSALGRGGGVSGLALSLARSLARCGGSGRTGLVHYKDRYPYSHQVR